MKGIVGHTRRKKPEMVEVEIKGKPYLASRRRAKEMHNDRVEEARVRDRRRANKQARKQRKVTMRRNG